MLTKPHNFYDETHKTTLGYQNLLYLSQAQRLQPTLCNGNVLIDKHNPVFVCDSEETLILAEESCLKINEKQTQDKAKPINYAKLNKIYEYFVPQKQLSAEQLYWSSTPSLSESISKPTKVYPTKLPSTSQVLKNLHNARDLLDKFDECIKRRTTLSPHQIGSWEQSNIKGAFKKDVIPFSKYLKETFKLFEKGFINEVKEMKDSFKQMEDEELLEEARVLKPLDEHIGHASKFDERIQELLVYVSALCPFTQSGNEKWAPTTSHRKNNKPYVDASRTKQTIVTITKEHAVMQNTRMTDNTMLPSTGRVSSTNASRSKPKSNTKNDRIPRICFSCRGFGCFGLDWVDSAEAVATTCYTQNRSLIHTRYNKTPYELLRDRKPELKYLHVFGALCYPTNDFEDLGKLQPKADIGIFINYSPSKKAYRIYKKKTRQIMETMNVQFDEITQIASKQHGSGPNIHGLTSGHISSGLVFNQAVSKSTKPPTKNDWDLLFQQMFNEYFKNPSAASNLISAATLPPPYTAGASSSSTSIDKDASSPSTSPNNEATNSPINSTNVEPIEEVVEFDNDTFTNPFAPPDTCSAELSSRIVDTSNMHTFQQPLIYIKRWTKDHLRIVEESCWIDAMLEEIHEFERLKVWELVPRPDKAMIISLKWIFKVKLYEYGGVLKNKARLVAKGYR
ncbi:integrase, catalytic region, zinc finger, CCHC-type containing protein [Tanacetum coccineum]